MPVLIVDVGIGEVSGEKETNINPMHEGEEEEETGKVLTKGDSVKAFGKLVKKEAVKVAGKVLGGGVSV